MDIHPPDGPTHSLRDFAIHIAVVTVGILIALSLEGVRETWRERAVVHDARENFRVEVEQNHKNILLELENTRSMSKQIDGMLADLPQLQQNPEKIAPLVDKIGPSFYFFASSSWESALSTGALGHMETLEVERYADVNTLVHYYAGIEAESLPIFIDLQAFFGAHRILTPTEVDAGIQKLMTFRAYVRTMVHVGDQLSSTIDAALKQ